MVDGARDDHSDEHLQEQTIDRFVRGALTPDLRAGVEAHLAGCASCVELLGLAAGRSQNTVKLPPQPAPATAAAAARAGQPLAPGTVLGRYTVLSLVGRGGSAAVYAA